MTLEEAAKGLMFTVDSSKEDTNNDIKFMTDTISEICKYANDNGIRISESDLKEALAYSDPYLFLGREIFKCVQDVMKKKIETDATYALRFALLDRPLDHVKEINVKFKED